MYLFTDFPPGSLSRSCRGLHTRYRDRFTVARQTDGVCSCVYKGTVIYFSMHQKGTWRDTLLNQYICFVYFRDDRIDNRLVTKNCEQNSPFVTSSSCLRFPVCEKVSGKCAKFLLALEEMRGENSEQKVLRGVIANDETATVRRRSRR
jgi:hypothetical protein